MSVLIEGMEMPKDCIKCPFCRLKMGIGNALWMVVMPISVVLVDRSNALSLKFLRMVG